MWNRGGFALSPDGGCECSMRMYALSVLEVTRGKSYQAVVVLMVA